MPIHPVEASPQFLEVHAHRGASALAPENTLAAFRKAIALGVDAMEMDLQVTRDGAVVVIHDDTLERTTDGKGRVVDLALEEVQRWDAGSKFAPAYRGERIPTLAEVIALVRRSGNDRVRLNLEIKYAKDHAGKPEDFEERVLRILREQRFVERVFIQSFHHPAPAKVKRLSPGIRTGLLIGGREPPADPVGLVRQYQADYYAPEFRHLTSKTVEALHRAGVPVVVWTVNEEADMRRMVSLGIGTVPGDGIISDHPDRLLSVVKALRTPTR